MKKIVIPVIFALFLSLACLSTTSISTTSISKGTQVFKNSAVRTVHVEIQVVEGTVNVRSCPSTTCRVVGYLYANQKIEVLGCLKNWCEVIVEEEIFYVYAPCVGQGTGVCK